MSRLLLPLTAPHGASASRDTPRPDPRAPRARPALRQPPQMDGPGSACNARDQQQLTFCQIRQFLNPSRPPVEKTGGRRQTGRWQVNGC